MDAADFLKWRKTLRYTQVKAAEKLGVSRATIQNWESGFTRVLTLVALACQVLTKRWKQRPEFGPVTLVYVDEPIWRKPSDPPREVFVQCELCASNDVAIQQAFSIRQAHRLNKTASFRNPLIIERDGDIIWSTRDLLRECDKRKKSERVKNETAASGADQDRQSRAPIFAIQDGASNHQVLKKRPAADTAQERSRQSKKHVMGMWDLKKWRRNLGYSQFEAAEQLGIGRAGFQHWESERTPVPLAVDLACGEITRRWKQQPKFGPVILVYTDEPLWPEADCPTHGLWMRCEPHPNNEIAIWRVCSLKGAPNFFNPLVIDEDGEIVWASPELLNECNKQRQE